MRLIAFAYYALVFDEYISTMSNFENGPHSMCLKHFRNSFSRIILCEHLIASDPHYLVLQLKTLARNSKQLKPK